jgi:hypothetical protein
MKVFDGFASPRWSEAEPGAGRKKMGVPEGANMNSPRWSEAEPGVGRKKMGVPGGGQHE